jgi:hypothetical protein
MKTLRQRLQDEVVVQYLLQVQYDKESKSYLADYERTKSELALHDGIRASYRADNANDKVEWLVKLLESTNADN